VTVNKTTNDPFPKLSGGTKETMVVSGTSVLRRREPTNTQTMSKMTNMVWDYSKQQKVWPDGKPNALIESTHATHSNENYRTINRSGRPYALGVQVGGSPDDGGRVYSESAPLKILK
jgi:hypothetical protein